MRPSRADPAPPPDRRRHGPVPHPPACRPPWRRLRPRKRSLLPGRQTPQGTPGQTRHRAVRPRPACGGRPSAAQPAPLPPPPAGGAAPLPPLPPPPPRPPEHRAQRRDTDTAFGTELYLRPQGRQPASRRGRSPYPRRTPPIPPSAPPWPGRRQQRVQPFQRPPERRPRRRRGRPGTPSPAEGKAELGQTTCRAGWELCHQRGQRSAVSSGPQKHPTAPEPPGRAADTFSASGKV